MRVETTIAVVGGTGAEGSGLALRFAKAGVPVRIGSRSGAKAETAAARIAALAGDGKDGPSVESYTRSIPRLPTLLHSPPL